MSTEELIIKSLDKCLETAEGEQRRLFLWMKAALQYSGLEQFMLEVKRAGECRGKVSLESLHKAADFAKSHNEFQIRGLSVSDDKKEEMVRLEKIRLDEVEVRVAGMLDFFGWLKKEL